MTFEQQFGVWVGGIIVLAALILYGAHLLTRRETFGVDRASTSTTASTTPPRHRRDAHPLDRAVVALAGGAADSPDSGRHHRSPHQHVRAA